MLRLITTHGRNRRHNTVIVIVVVSETEMLSDTKFGSRPKTSGDVLMEIVKKSDGPAPLEDVERTLARSGYLGFGVEAIDAIDSAVKNGMLKFDPAHKTLTSQR